jgi:oxygen-independent coproporphyrinogen-3 oxidase
LDRQAFRLQTGFDLDELTAPALERCQALGLLHDDGLKVALTREGRFVADTIIADLYAGGRPSRFPLRS